jgi:acyl carrier protein
VDALARLQRILRDAFDDPSLVVTPEFSMASYQDWDSVATVGIVLATEEEFGIRFTTDEVANTHSVADLLRVVQARTR